MPVDQLLELLKSTDTGFVDHVAFCWASAGIVASAAMSAVDISSDAAMRAKERGAENRLSLKEKALKVRMRQRMRRPKRYAALTPPPISDCHGCSALVLSRDWVA
jgi:hypothetical protein